MDRLAGRSDITVLVRSFSTGSLDVSTLISCRQVEDALRCALSRWMWVSTSLIGSPGYGDSLDMQSAIGIDFPGLYLTVKS